MKTSNKLLIGLFATIVVCMVITNIILKNKVENNTESSNQVQINVQLDSLAVDTDSIAMDAAIGNE